MLEEKNKALKNKSFEGGRLEEEEDE